MSHGVLPGTGPRYTWYISSGMSVFNAAIVRYKVLLTCNFFSFFVSAQFYSVFCLINHQNLIKQLMLLPGQYNSMIADAIQNKNI